VVVIALATVVVFSIGAFNPWNNVLLLEWFSNPFAGLMAVAVLTYFALWLLFPVRNEATQRRRIGIRITLVVVAFLALMGFGVYGAFYYSYDGTPIETSPNGERAVAAVEQAGYPGVRLHVYQGNGMATVDLGVISPDCGGNDGIDFIDDDTIQIDNPYGDFVIPLDPETGVPQARLVTCDRLAQT
jgi:hypothetical protein